MKLIRPGMGTENALLMLASLIQMKRPQLCLEIGAGDSTLAIANALIQAKKEHDLDRQRVESETWSEKGELLIPGQVLSPYQPCFISIDNFSAEGCSASQAWTELDKIAPQDLKTVKLNTDFFGLQDSFYTEHSAFDLIWIDAGTLADDTRFLGKLWPHLNDGGLLCLHEPYFTASVQTNRGQQLSMTRTPLWEALIKSPPPNSDIFSLPETHKYRQSGLGILRKHESWERNRRSSFQEEMIAVDEAPLRFSVTGFSESRPRDLTDKQLEKPDVLKLIAQGLDSQKNYTEQSLSEYCSYFTDDFARLRRALTDQGYIVKTRDIPTKYKVNES